MSGDRMNKKSFAVIAIALCLFVPTISQAADPVYPEGVPAPGRSCGDATGVTVVDTIAGKALTCKSNGVENIWQFVDGTAIPSGLGGYKATPLPNDGIDEAFTAPEPPAMKNYQGLYHNDLAGLTRLTSALLNFQPTDKSPTTVTACKSLSDSACSGTGVTKYEAVLPTCDSVNPTNCLSDIYATKADGTKVQGIVKGIFNHDNPQNFTGDSASGLPTGTEPTLVQFPGVNHSNGDLFLVKPHMIGHRNQGETMWSTESFKVSIFAVKMVDGTFGFNQFSTDAANYQNNIGEAGGSVIGANTSPGCAAESKTQCAAMYPLPLDVSFAVSIKFSKALVGWLHGRVTSPTISLQNDAKGGALLTIDAKAIKTPTNSVWVTNEQMPQSLRNWYGNDHGGTIFYQGATRDLFAPFSEIALLRDGNSQHNERTLSEYVQWLPLLGEKAQAMPTMWAVETMSQEGDPRSPIVGCINKQKNLAGLVTTNAAEYIDGPPVYTDGTLDYKVAATHFEKDGSTFFQGTYDLLMSSEVARCIYGFTKAPIKATISVTNDTGGGSVASTVIKEEKGWLTLGAYGFTFSNPTIRVKLTQDASVKPVAKTSTITCIKGKTTKQVTAAKPTCPSGYKKK